ncbi:HEL025Wp [Eremothecium sinecaudum]|uniref:HEL025Wp n=1 Tax=Eremothecium sinecaudum TaxID=45286 RepID=A0A109UZD2_9SACH|nr:HEL025Wp [Eremothecium sinecaudum]AMD21255.1 HEL025Wp [Eremothecium sinecaudum]
MISKRALSTLIPPKIVSAKNLASSGSAKRIANVVEFYKTLPTGPAPARKPSNLFAKYRTKYFEGDNASAKPLVHVVLLILGIGYTMEYNFHLKHHKEEGAH